MTGRISTAATHPGLYGIAGAAALLAALLTPVALGLELLTHTTLGSLSTSWVFLSGAFGALIGVWLFNKVLYNTRVGRWIGEFEAWCQEVNLTDEEGFA